jgi:hypothetical protein
LPRGRIEIGASEHSEVLQRLQNGGRLQSQGLVYFGVAQIAAVLAELRISGVPATRVGAPFLVDRADVQRSLPVIPQGGSQSRTGIQYSILLPVRQQFAQDTGSFNRLKVQFVIAVIGSVKIEERTPDVLQPIYIGTEAFKLIFVAAVYREVDEKRRMCGTANVVDDSVEGSPTRCAYSTICPMPYCLSCQRNGSPPSR